MLNSIYHKDILPNGIRVVSEQIPSVHSVSIGVWVNTGSRFETRENNGIAHFLEHMFFKGTENRTAFEIATSLESLGGNLNAATSKEVCFYTAHVLSEHLPIAVDVLADLLLNARFEPADIELEKEVVSAEIKLYQESPEDLVFDNFYELLYPDHPMGYRIHGTLENVLAFQRKDLIDFLTDQYTADRFVVAAAGKVEHNELLEIVERFFGNVPPSRNKPNSRLTGSKRGRHVFENEVAQQAHICLGSTGFKYGHEKRYALGVLETLLGNGMGSRLFQNIREKYGFAYNIYAFSDLMSDTGTFGVYVACAKDRVEKSIELIRNEFDLIRKNSITRDELERTKSQIRGSSLLSMESTGRRMRRLADMEMYLGEFKSLDELLAKVDAVTFDDIQEVADTLLRPEVLLTTILRTPGN